MGIDVIIIISVLFVLACARPAWCLYKNPSKQRLQLFKKIFFKSIAAFVVVLSFAFIFISDVKIESILSSDSLFMLPMLIIYGTIKGLTAAAPEAFEDDTPKEHEIVSAKERMDEIYKNRKSHNK